LARGGTVPYLIKEQILSPPLANDCMDAEGRVTQEQLPRGGLGWGEKIIFNLTSETGT